MMFVVSNTNVISCRSETNISGCPALDVRVKRSRNLPAPLPVLASRDLLFRLLKSQNRDFVCDFACMAVLEDF